jgi:hypothetical protein
MNPAGHFYNLAATDRSVAARRSSGLKHFLSQRSKAILCLLKRKNFCTQRTDPSLNKICNLFMWEFNCNFGEDLDYDSASSSYQRYEGLWWLYLQDENVEDRGATSHQPPTPAKYGESCTRL